MTGRLSGVATRIQEEAGDGVVRVWLALHQLDLVVQAHYLHLHDDRFVNVLTGLVSYLRRQYNLISRMNSTCSKFMYTRCTSMKNLSEFLRRNRATVCDYLDVKKPTCTPLPSGWVQLLALDAVFTEITSVVRRQQDGTLCSIIRPILRDWSILSCHFAQFNVHRMLKLWLRLTAIRM